MVLTEGRPDETGLTMARALDDMHVPVIAILDSAVAYALEAFRRARPTDEATHCIHLSNPSEQVRAPSLCLRRGAHMHDALCRSPHPLYTSVCAGVSVVVVDAS